MSDAGTMYANAKALHELLQESRAENAELRKERDALDRLTDVLDDTNDGLLAENAKLRELVRDLYECVSHANEQDWFYFERHMLGCGMSCTVNGEGCGLSVLADRMRELGIEV